MAYTSEIEKLEKRWAENPKGRNFAPLADAYRKAGELDRAIELCKSGLERHPDYVSAHIVYGRCFLDLKNDTTASQVFRKVLELDPENVLGLKLLADIAERGGRYGEATEWLSRLLTADPMNGDAAEALARNKGKAAQAAPKPAPSAASAPPPPPPAVLVPERPAASGPTTAPMPRPEFVVEHSSEEQPAPQLEVAPRTGDIETFDGTLDFDAVAHDAAKAEGLEVGEEVALKPQELEVEGLAATQYESGTFAARADAAPEPEPDLPTVDLPLIMPEDLAPPRPPAVASPSSPPAPPALPEWPAPLAPPRPPAAVPPAAVALSDDDGAADTAALSRAEPVLTETMADLYLKQGHPEEALRVYRALLAQRPDDVRLHARVAALSPGKLRSAGRGTGESVPMFLRRILGGRPQAAASSLERAFAVASPEVVPQRDDATLGEASRPAEDTISLDQVFGDEGSRASPPAAEPAAPNPASSAPPAPAPGATGGFSFDQFFGASGARPEDAATPPGGAPRGSARPSGPKLRAPLEDEGDLDQFQAWLKGLKS